MLGFDRFMKFEYYIIGYQWHNQDLKNKKKNSDVTTSVIIHKRNQQNLAISKTKKV